MKVMAVTYSVNCFSKFPATSRTNLLASILMPVESQTFADLDDLLEKARQGLPRDIAHLDHLVALASMFERIRPEQRRELISQFHDQAGRLPYVNDADAGSLVLEKCADNLPLKALRRQLYRESLYRAQWCAQGATSPGEGIARSIHIRRLEFKLSGALSTPGEIELSAWYSMHLGPRFEGAGLTLQFHYNQEPGIHFKVESSAEYRDAILNGIKDGMALRFPNFPSTGSIWITGVNEHPVDSSQNAFYRAARLVIDQAYALPNIRYSDRNLG